MGISLTAKKAKLRPICDADLVAAFRQIGDVIPDADLLSELAKRTSWKPTDGLRAFVPDVILLAELLRPEREAVLKTAWSRYTSAKRVACKGWPKGKKRTKQKTKAPRGAMPAKG